MNQEYKLSGNSKIYFLESLKIIGLNTNDIMDIAYKTGFISRTPKKITPQNILATLCVNSQNTSPSYNNMASSYHASFCIEASKQAFWKRVNNSCVEFFMAILEHLIKFKINKNELSIDKRKGGYKRILVQDSTIIKIPFHLFDEFSGVRNQYSQVCNSRIQGIYDLLSKSFVSFSIDPYAKNDYAAAPEIELEKQDLVLRDRGYYKTDEIQRHIEAGAHCIYRYKLRNLFLDVNSAKPIDLLEKLRKHGQLDIEVLLNNKDKAKVRIIAIPVSEEIANQRRRHAKKDCRNKNMSAEALALMGWSIFITTIPASLATPNQIINIYRLRWRIEIIFKSWKSYMNFDKIHKVSANQLRAILIARFILIVLYSNVIYSHYYPLIKDISGKKISLLKLINYITLNFEITIDLVNNIKSNSMNMKLCINALIKYCTYDKRKRLNFSQLMEIAFLS